MRPLVGAIRSAITRSNVDLPQPDGPSSVRKLPRGIARSMLSSAVTVPRSLVKRTLTLSQETAVSANGGFADMAASLTGSPAMRVCHITRGWVMSNGVAWCSRQRLSQITTSPTRQSW